MAGCYIKFLLFLFPLLSEIFVNMVALETESPKLFIKGNNIAPCACVLFTSNEKNSSPKKSSATSRTPPSDRRDWSH